MNWRTILPSVLLAAAVLWISHSLSFAYSNSPDEATKKKNEEKIMGGDRIVGKSFATRSPVLGQRGMAATAHPLASQIAIDILKQGGSAVDAAVAANAALGLMEPVGNGIGGDLFAIVWDPKIRKLYGYNGSGRSPKGRSYDGLIEKLGGANEIPAYGSLPVTVPGTVDGWFALHARFGQLSMADVLAPATKYARDGFPVSQVIAYYWQRNMQIFEERGAPHLEEIENARATYLINGVSPKEGDVFRNPDLAKTFDNLARDGRDAFYSGNIAKTIDQYMKRIGGDLRLEDLQNHEGEWVEPVGVTYRGYELFELPPNTQGVAALQMLKILEGYDLAGHGRNSPEALHYMVEAKRLAFEDMARTYGDPNFSDVPIEWLLSDAHIEEQRERISSDEVADLTEIPQPPEIGDTTYLTVADQSGMMVSLIQSNYRGMGSGLVPDGLGFMLQNRGQLFNLDPDHPNGYAPGKRPFHTIIPAFLMRDGEPLMSFGLMGGAMQPQGHVQIMDNMIDFGLNVQEAGDAARFYHSGTSEPTGRPSQGVGTLYLESGINQTTRDALEALGHKVEDGRGQFGGYQAIWRDPETGVYFGASEMRKDGQAIGY